MVNLVIARKKKNLSQQELARLSGVPQRTISSIETGFRKNPGIDTLAMLAAALGCSIDDLIRKESENDV